jgi:AAA+ ATPase superfamily predicted ATPase
MKTEKNNIPTEIRDMFEYINSKNFTSYTTLQHLRFIAETEYLPQLKELDEKNYEEYVKKIKDFNFYAGSDYDNSTDKEKLLMWALDCFRNELLIVIDKKYNKNRIPALLVRQTNPPLSAYKMVAFCKSEIKPTGREYGLLFE